MFSYIYHTFVFDPLYNGFIFLIGAMPWADVGVVVILLTLIVKVILFPLTRKAVRTQMVMKLAEPDLRLIKEKYTNKQEQAMKVMEYYKQKNINPFSGILLLLIQIPILLALYKVFYSNGLSTINTEILYSFVSVPTSINEVFLGIFDITQKSYVLALVAGVSQFIYAYLASPKTTPRKEKATFSDDLTRNMHLQMKYFLPIFIFFVSYHAAAALALYWATSNIFTIFQELFVRKELAKSSLNKLSTAPIK
jgi:YidC/Oxa1 family membrane protein insertase